jgi:hypothetical protein
VARSSGVVLVLSEPSERSSSSSSKRKEWGDDDDVDDEDERSHRKAKPIELDLSQFQECQRRLALSSGEW